MKTNPAKAVTALLSAAIVFASCQKSDLGATTTDSSSASPTIAVAATGINNTAGAADSVYLLQPCQRGEKRDTVAQSALPSPVSAYIDANYSGASFAKAFALKNSSAVVTGYVVVIYYDNKPVGLQFDSTGAFVKVLEQREKGDLEGAGHHHGGRFEDRDGQQRDTIALTALPAAVTTYFAANYATDTLVKAFRNRDNGILVLSKNNGLFATVFTADGVFVKRETLPAKPGQIQGIELAALPSVAANYLSQTYPNYVFKKAFSVSQAGVVKGFVVFIDANNTRYAVEFDASGSFVKAKTIQ